MEEEEDVVEGEEDAGKVVADAVNDAVMILPMAAVVAAVTMLAAAEQGRPRLDAAAAPPPTAPFAQ